MNKQLKRITDRDVTRSSSSPPRSGVFDTKAVTIHDGDTCDLVFVRNGRFERFKSRLFGINSSELGTGGIKALKSRDFLAWLCVGRDVSTFPHQSQPWSEMQLQGLLNENRNLVYAEFNGSGGYGRPLVTLKSQSWSGPVNSFNDVLMENGYAQKYRRGRFTH